MESEWDMANGWLKWTYSLSNPMLEEGMKKPLPLEKFLLLPRAMRTDFTFSKLRGEGHACAHPILYSFTSPIG